MDISPSQEGGNMRISFFVVIVYFLVIFASFPLHAQSRLRLQEDASQAWERIYAQALENLRSGLSKEKIRAAYVLGTQRNPRFLRPLLEELLKDLNPKRKVRITDDEPYVKSVIAWAAGHIGHPIALPSMLKALDFSIQLAQNEIKRAEKLGAQKEELSKKARQEDLEQAQIDKVKDIVIKPTHSGPFLENKKIPGFYYNGDKYWSLSDQLQGRTAWLSVNHSDDISRFGANYLNLARSIFIALGKIGSQKAVAKISTYLEADANLEAVRTYAAFALGDIGESKAVEKLVLAFDKEKVPLVKIGIGYAVLRNDKTRSPVYNFLISFLQKGTRRERLAAAKTFEKLAMGESLENLKAAYRLENDMRIRSVLEKAINNAVKNLLKVFFNPPSS